MIEPEEKPEACDNCFEEHRELLWDKEAELWVCLECEKELQDERELMRGVEDRSVMSNYYEDEE